MAPMSASRAGRNVSRNGFMTGRAVAGKSRVASPIARCGASVYIAASLSGLIVARDHGRWALSSAVEHYLDMVGVRGSIPLAPTISFNGLRETGSAAGRAG